MSSSMFVVSIMSLEDAEIIYNIKNLLLIFFLKRNDNIEILYLKIYKTLHYKCTLQIIIIEL